MYAYRISDNQLWLAQRLPCKFFCHSSSWMQLFPLSSLHHFICIFFININISSFALLLLVHIFYLLPIQKASFLGGRSNFSSQCCLKCSPPCTAQRGCVVFILNLNCTRGAQLLGKMWLQTVVRGYSTLAFADSHLNVHSNFIFFLDLAYQIFLSFVGGSSIQKFKS
jgi:hypothetical protein